MNIFIILPTQLFEYNEYLDKMDNIYIIEEPFYFTSKSFHKQKLILHRASMKYYYDKLKKKYKNIEYIEYDKIKNNEFINKTIHIYDPVDKPVIEKYRKISQKMVIYDTPLFLETRAELEEYRNTNTNKKNYYHDNFYKWQRKRLQILMEDREQPIGGKWSFDKENRNPYDKNYKEDKIITYSNKYIE